MNTPARLVAFGAGLVAVFLAAAAAGSAAGPLDVGGEDHADEHAGSGSTPAPDAGHDHDGAGGQADHGVSATELRLVTTQATAGAGVPIHYRFTIDGAHGPITAFDELHERRLHLIVVSDDLVDFWHVHPEMTADGTWHVDLPALDARVYSLYADVHPTGGEQTTVRARLTVTDDGTAASPRPLPAPAESTLIDGLEVTLSGTPVVGESLLRFDVARDGEAVRTEPYLGAAGHLVAIRTSDLAYLHVHPVDSAGPEINFAAALPSAGTYRLFLDVAVDREVHTASFTVEVPPGAPGPAEGGDHGAPG